MDVYLPDERDVLIARYGCGNRKIGPTVFTYSRIAGHPVGNENGTCPGATTGCEAICYAKRIRGAVRDIYLRNGGDDVPAIPAPCQLLRIHISGDFDSVAYIERWIARLGERPDVVAWAYTRSWRVPELLLSLERLRALPNVQLFASMDASHRDLPPVGWRRSWILTDAEDRLARSNTSSPDGYSSKNLLTLVVADDTPSYVCPEETGRARNCEECGYCFDGKTHDVTFLEH